MKDILEKLLNAADNHGQDDDPDHTVGDLQDLLRRAWTIMSVGERRRLLGSDEAAQVAEAGARGEFDAGELVDELDQAVDADFQSACAVACWPPINHNAHVMRIKETEMLANHQAKRPFNLTLNEATVEQARRYTNNLSATVDGLLADFIARESTERQDKQQLRDDVCDALNQFNAVYGSFADEYSTL